MSDAQRESIRDCLYVARDIHLVAYIIIKDLPLNLSLMVKKLYEYRNIAESCDGDKCQST